MGYRALLPFLRADHCLERAEQLWKYSLSVANLISRMEPLELQESICYDLANLLCLVCTCQPVPAS